MGMTITEKNMARHAGLDVVKPGQIIECHLDAVLMNDITFPPARKEFLKIGKPVFDRHKIYLVPDHFTPNKDIQSATQAKVMRDFVREHGITNYFEVGRMGIEHVILPEKGLIGPGEMMIGADSHTCTYGAVNAFSTGVGSTDAGVAMAEGKTWFKVPETIKVELIGKPNKWVTGKDVILDLIGQIGVDGARYMALEFAGDGVQHMTMADRLTICNMAIEAGGKCGVFPYDAVTEEYIKGRVNRPVEPIAPDADAVYAQTITIDLSKLQPVVAFPHLPSNTHYINEIDKDIKIDQVIIGSCTNGRYEDLVAAAEIFKGRKVAPFVRCIVIPGSQDVYDQAMKDGLLDIFIQADCAVSTPTCGPCLGGYMGIMAEGERTVSIESKKIWRYGDDVDTDVIIPARYLAIADWNELAEHAMEDIDTTFAPNVKAGEIMVAGKNFGCGSSREHAPGVIKAKGVPVIIAHSFARIFFRNAINIGLPVIEIGEQVDRIDAGDAIGVDLSKGIVYNLTKNEQYQGTELPQFIQDIAAAGGLVNFAKNRK